MHDSRIANLYYQEFMARYLAGKPQEIKDKKPILPNVKVYPNPSDDIFYIEWPDDYHLSVTVSLIDMKGSKVYSKRINGLHLKKISVDPGNLESGIYLIEVKGTGKRFLGRVLIR